jgi:hypothetical protein
MNQCWFGRRECVYKASDGVMKVTQSGGVMVCLIAVCCVEWSTKS